MCITYHIVKKKYLTISNIAMHDPSLKKILRKKKEIRKNIKYPNTFYPVYATWGTHVRMTVYDKVHIIPFVWATVYYPKLNDFSYFKLLYPIFVR